MEMFFLLAGSTGQRLCVHHGPPAGTAVRANVLYVHPWAEEMNKSRRMAALQSRALAAAGCAVLQIDLQGCGDSSGDFADASWQRWVEDVLQGVQWLQERQAAPLYLWGLRAGALLAAQAAAQIEQPCNLLLWQPVLAGQTVLQQFLRLKAAAGLGQINAKATLDSARNELAAGRYVNIAGYALSAALANGLALAELTPPPRGRVYWLEVSSRSPAAMLPHSASCIEAWLAQGVEVAARAVSGPPFWQTQEIEDAGLLIEATTDAMRNAGLALAS